MELELFRDILRQTLDDRRLSRGERTALGKHLEDAQIDRRQAEGIQRDAFELARETIDSTNGAMVVEWLGDIVKALQKVEQHGEREEMAEAWFSPQDDCPRRICSLIASARSEIDICVFTITDDRLTSAILDAHGRGARIRIVTDDEKSDDLGSDAEQLLKAGIEIRIDRSPFHMHHKFAMFDRKLLLNGSYNWTRGAAVNNEENFVVTNNRRLIAAFSKTFENLWNQFAKNRL